MSSDIFISLGGGVDLGIVDTRLVIRKIALTESTSIDLGRATPWRFRSLIDYTKQLAIHAQEEGINER